MQQARRAVVRRRVATAVSLALGGGLVAGTAHGEPPRPKPTEYVASVQVSEEAAEDQSTVRGVVFDDRDRDGRRDRSEAGVRDVTVSNGREVVRTDQSGSYELPAYDGMTVFVTKPAAFDVPVDENNVPQFFYHHLPEGSPDLRFGGLPPTGPLPASVDFPIARTAPSKEVDCAIIGDPQTYSNRELGYLRDGVVADLAAREDLDECGALIVGDVGGDDLGLFPRIKEVMSLADIPVRAVPGNHDLDYDATDDANSFDTYKREIGPAYYSYDVGGAHFVGLDNVRYPCTEEDGHSFCNDPENHPTYNGKIGEEQLTWLENDLATVPEDKLVVIATHIPLVSFLDQEYVKHQTDDVQKLYDLVEGRPALSVFGHTQVVENLAPGDSYAGWQENLGVDKLPFRHLTVGAASGSWWLGNLGSDGLPEATQREGAPTGYMNLEIDGSEYVETYRATGRAQEEQMSLAVSSPFFREWFDAINAWKQQRPGSQEEPPPVNINDLGDPNLLTRKDLAGGSYLVANVWNGSSETSVSVQVDDRRPVEATRTQAAAGEGVRRGAEFGDPSALMRQLQVTRHALESTSGNARTQGWEAFRGAKFGPGPAQPLELGQWAQQSSHLWRLPLPEDLAEGAHTAKVRVTDRQGRTWQETLMFEVTAERPPMFFRKEKFD
jgi:3',5'-cyclic AMP phosphodiesterase CpdA